MNDSDYLLIRIPKAPAAAPPLSPEEELVRVNFQISKAKQRKLKILVARSEHKSIKDFLTAYIDSFPGD